jgi:hypothetical protein
MINIETHYVGEITNTHRWESFAHREDDIFYLHPAQERHAASICLSL